tara:strand:+ start:7529 stop:8509 length:981 start_codon:yes stop_codon:yes gene_type:complete
MKILIIKGDDVHTRFRIVPGFTVYGCSVTVVEDYKDLTGERFDLTLVDPSVNFDPTSKLNTDKLMFYDCEDGPEDFKSGEAYNVLKDKVIAYVKMNWVDNDIRNDGIKNIGFPLPIYSSLRPVTSFQSNHSHYLPFLVCSPTFIGHYDTNEEIDTNLDIRYLSKVNEETIYSQRLQWFLSLHQNKIDYSGGIVFQNNNSNLSLSWQKKYFGDVDIFQHSAISREDYIRYLLKFNIALCPSGHERISWRIFDAMATGSIIFSTQLCGQRSMIMPKEFIQIRDNEDISLSLTKYIPDYSELLKASNDNRDLFKISNEQIMRIFNDQTH